MPVRAKNKTVHGEATKKHIAVFFFSSFLSGSRIDYNVSALNCQPGTQRSRSKGLRSAAAPLPSRAPWGGHDYEDRLPRPQICNVIVKLSLARWKIELTRGGKTTPEVNG